MFDELFKLESAHPTDAASIAARVRGVLGGQDHGNVAATADRLGVSELALRMTIDDVAPQPNLVVILAIIREYGVDPMWILTGEYDLATHRRAMEDDRLATANVLQELARRSSGPMPNGSPHLRLVEDAQGQA
jgi:hypothetical protein